MHHAQIRAASAVCRVVPVVTHEEVTVRRNGKAAGVVEDRVSEVDHLILGQSLTLPVDQPLIEQLRRFLASRTFLENRRAGQVIEEIEQLALQVKNDPPPQRFFSAIAGKPAVNLVMERRLFQPADELQLDTDHPVPGNAVEVLAEGLYNQLYIDPEELKGRVQKCCAANSR